MKLKKMLALVIVLIFPVVANAEILLRDNFEYEATRTGLGGMNFTKRYGGPWDGVKAINTTVGSGAGYIYTVTSIPGFSGNFPGTNSNRVACFEFLPGTYGYQTDTYLLYGSDRVGYVPANTWIQFWLYLQRYGSQMSRFDTGKWLYPCYEPGYGTCNYGGHDWMIVYEHWTAYPYYQIDPEENLNKNVTMTLTTSPVPGRETITGPYPYPNGAIGGIGKIGATTGRPQVFIPNTWYLIKMNMDMSNPSSGKWKMWARKASETEFTLLANFVGGSTPTNVNWRPLYTSGMRWLKLHSTIDNYDSWWYYDDFVIATSEADLPTYSSSGPLPPSNLRIIP